MNKDEIKKLLPAVFQRTVHEGNPLMVLLEVMQEMQEPAENTIRGIDNFFNPYQTTEEFVPFLAFWVDLNRLFVTNEEIDFQSSLTPKIGFLREVIANAAHLSKLRGTNKGLILFLQTITGEKKFSIFEKVKNEQGQILPFHIKVVVPKELNTQTELIRRIIDSEKPIHLTYEIEFE